jgi:hypothetical protein
MKKYFFLLIPLAFLCFAVSGCGKKCNKKGDVFEFGNFDFRLLSKTTGEPLISNAGTPYHKDTVRLYRMFSGALEIASGPSYIDPTGGGYFFRNVPIYGYSGPDYTERYVLYLNQFDSDTISVKAINVSDCPTIAEFYYNGVLYGQHEFKDETAPLFIFKK